MRLVPGVDVIKLFGGNQDSRKGFVVMPEPALKCENNVAIFKQNYSLKLFIAF